MQTGDDVMIGGFIILAQDAQGIVRAIGPSLPVPGALADPTLELVNRMGHDRDERQLAERSGSRDHREHGAANE